MNIISFAFYIYNKFKENKILKEINELFSCILVLVYILTNSITLKYMLIFSIIYSFLESIYKIGKEIYERKYYKNNLNKNKNG